MVWIVPSQDKHCEGPADNHWPTGLTPRPSSFWSQMTLLSWRSWVDVLRCPRGMALLRTKARTIELRSILLWLKRVTRRSGYQRVSVDDYCTVRTSHCLNWWCDAGWLSLCLLLTACCRRYNCNCIIIIIDCLMIFHLSPTSADWDTMQRARTQMVSRTRTHTLGHTHTHAPLPLIVYSI